MRYLKLFESFSFKEYIEEITTLCLVELEDNGYQVSITPRYNYLLDPTGESEYKSYIVSIGQIDGLTNLVDIESYLMTYIDLIKSKSDIKINNINAFLKGNCEGYNSNRASLNYIQKETLNFNGSYDDFFNYIRNKPMRSIMFVIDKI